MRYRYFVTVMTGLVQNNKYSLQERALSHLSLAGFLHQHVLHFCIPPKWSAKKPSVFYIQHLLGEDLCRGNGLNSTRKIHQESFPRALLRGYALGHVPFAYRRKIIYKAERPYLSSHDPHSHPINKSMPPKMTSEHKN